MNKHITWRGFGMSIALSLLTFFSTSNVNAQRPHLKTADIPDSVAPILRSEGLLTSHWTQNYPYNQLCPRDPANNYAYCYAGCPAIAMGQIINYLQK